MIYPKVDPSEWAIRYGIERTELKCPDCGIAVALSVPFAFDDMRGLGPEPHGCETQAPYVMVAVDGSESAAFWNSVAERFQ